LRTYYWNKQNAQWQEEFCKEMHGVVLRLNYTGEKAVGELIPTFIQKMVYYIVWIAEALCIAFDDLHVACEIQAASSQERPNDGLFEVL
jgi:hypothetical protein